MRVLIAPEAIDGARQLGIHFANATVPSGAPQLSDPVSLAYPGDRSYFLVMPNGAVVRLSKDKVWGVVTEPNRGLSLSAPRSLPPLSSPA